MAVVDLDISTAAKNPAKKSPGFPELQHLRPHPPRTTTRATKIGAAAGYSTFGQMVTGDEVGMEVDRPLFGENVEGDGEEYSFDLKALREWMITFVVCDFNVDVGVEVEYMFPHADLSDADIDTICFSSFPEKSNSDSQTPSTDSTFFFKFRHTSGANVPYTPSSIDPTHWYGYCLFRQQYDPTAKRNYRQKSLILISQHEFPPLFQHVVKTISLLEFEVGKAIVESACANIANWGPPEVGVRELPFLGEVLEVHTESRPPHYAFPLQGLMPKSKGQADLAVEIHTSGPVGSWARLGPLLSSLSELYVIFERALLSEPLVVLALDPRDASEFVSAVVDMIRPIPFAGDSRPFFPMQSDLPSESRDPLPLRHYLIGITNPFFLKRLLAQQNNDQNPSSTSSPAHVVYLAGPETRYSSLHRSKARLKKSSSLKKKLRPRSLLSYHSYLSSPKAESREWDYPSHMTPSTESKTLIAKDHGFLQELEDKLRDPKYSRTARLLAKFGLKKKKNKEKNHKRTQKLTCPSLTPTEAQDFDKLLRRHFALLTAYFLAPLNRYLATLASPNSANPSHIDMANFSEEEFIASLAKWGCSVPFKGKTGFLRQKNAEAFYRKFLRSPSFFTWLEMKMSLKPIGDLDVGIGGPAEVKIFGGGEE